MVINEGILVEKTSDVSRATVQGDAACQKCINYLLGYPALVIGILEGNAEFVWTINLNRFVIQMFAAPLHAGTLVNRNNAVKSRIKLVTKSSLR